MQDEQNGLKTMKQKPRAFLLSCFSISFSLRLLQVLLCRRSTTLTSTTRAIFSCLVACSCSTRQHERCLVGGRGRRCLCCGCFAQFLVFFVSSCQPTKMHPRSLCIPDSRTVPTAHLALQSSFCSDGVWTNITHGKISSSFFVHHVQCCWTMQDA